MYSGRRYCHPGERVPQSGVYVVTHHEHRPDHCVVAIEGEVFPHCSQCRERVRFKLDMPGEYVLNDADFSSSDFVRSA